MTVTKITTIIQLIRSLSWQQALIIFLIASLAITYIFRLLTPTQVEPQPTVFTNIFNMSTDLQNITFSGTAPAIPSSMTTATLVSYDESINEVKERLINKLALKEKPGKVEVWENETHVVSILSDPFLIVLSKKDASTKKTPTTTGFSANSITQIKSQADNLIAELFPENTPPILESDMMYLTDSIEPQFTANQQEAGLLYIPYAYQLNGYPIFLEKELYYVAYLVYNTQAELVKAEIRPYQITMTEERSYNSLTTEMAISNINNNHLALIYTEPFRGESSIKSTTGDMKTANIEYRIDPSAQTIAPYYRFSGIIADNNKESVVELLTPAIQTNFQNSDAQE